MINTNLLCSPNIHGGFMCKGSVNGRDSLPPIEDSSIGDVFFDNTTNSTFLFTGKWELMSSYEEEEQVNEEEQVKPLVDNKCPNCGAPLINTKYRTYKCEYCDSVFER